MADDAGVTPRLAQRLAAVPGTQAIEVIVELTPRALPATGSRAERVAALRTAFEADLTPVAALVADAGGEVLERAWINQTVRARVPAAAAGRLATAAGVVRVDLPGPLSGPE